LTEKNTKEAIKRYAVIALAVVFLAVGYFQFFRETKKPVPTATAAQPETQLVAPEVKPLKTSKDVQARVPAAERRPAVIRDIFAPGESAPSPEKTSTETPETPAATAFTLKGTIVAGARPAAIINGRFVRTGDWIDGYQVVKIDRKNVWLESGGHRISVDAMPHE